MNIKPAMAVPLPWLTIIAGRLFGRDRSENRHRRNPFRFPRSLSITTEGKWYIGILLIIGVAAINTGNNLLYLVVSMMLSIIIISGILSESSLRGVKVARDLPRHVYKGQTAMVRVRIVNRKSWFPSFSIFTDEAAATGLTSERTYTLKLRPGAGAVKTSRYTFTRRGRVELTGFKVSTRFPFCIFLKGKEELVTDTVIVYPRVDLARIRKVADEAGSQGSNSSARRGSGGTLYGLREYTLTDDARFIHWRSAARSARLFYKEQERETERELMVVLENYRSPVDSLFESAVDEAAGLANHYISKGFRVGLRTLETEIPPGRGTQKLHSILHALALVTPVDVPGTPGVTVREL